MRWVSPSLFRSFPPSPSPSSPSLSLPSISSLARANTSAALRNAGAVTSTSAPERERARRDPRRARLPAPAVRLGDDRVSRRRQRLECPHRSHLVVRETRLVGRRRERRVRRGVWRRSRFLRRRLHGRFCGRVAPRTDEPVALDRVVPVRARPERDDRDPRMRPKRPDEALAKPARHVLDP